jgi:ADP-ribose pyrophosphatase YjhB (NUDIX family)
MADNNTNQAFAKKFATMTADSDPQGSRHIFYSSCSVFVEKDGKLLMVEEKKYDVSELALDPPSTHVLWSDNGVQQAAVRGVKKETGYDVTLTDLVGVYEIDIFERHYYHFVFIGTANSEEPTNDITDDDIQNVTWVDKNDTKKIIPRLRSDALRQAYRDYIDCKKYPLELLTNIGRTH